jgi:5-formyltetrahydrofolate cyclo-ligase
VNKKDLRKKYLQKRQELTPSDIDRYSADILNLFSGLTFDGIKYAHIFYPIVGKHEFNSLLICDWFKINHPEVSLVLPKIIKEQNIIKSILWDESTSLAMNEWGITEPEFGVEVPNLKLDLMILPLLAFDQEGNRLGYGKGFYDRLLSACRKDVIKIGTSFFEPEEKFEEIDAFDIPMTICITPKKIYKFD